MSSAPQHGSPSTGTWSDERFGQLTYIVLASFLAVFTLFSIPRAVARFSSEPWPTRQGFFLRFSAPIIRDPLQREPSGRKPVAYRNGGSYSPQSANLHQIALQNLSRRPRLLPTHFPSWKTVFYPLSHFTSARVPLFNKYSVAQAIVLVTYAALFGVVMLLFTNPVGKPLRPGWIAVSQAPVLFALGSKNSIVGLLIGRGYERLNFLHRWVGLLMFIAVLFHVVSFLVIWTKAHTLTHRMTQPFAIWGIVALGAMSFLAMGAIPNFRKRFYSIFLNLHWVGFITLLVALPYHAPDALPYSLACVAIQSFDLILRLTKSHYITATLHYIPELGSTRITVPNLRTGWRAGQHVRLMVPSFSMGVLYMMESHLFTIASPSDDEEGLVLYAKDAGDWTKKLGVMAKGGTTATYSEKGMGHGRLARVVVQGPFGGPGHAVFSSYSAALVICGGSGISFGLSVLQEMIRDAFDRSSRVRLIDFVWTVRDPTGIIPLLPTFTKLIEQTDAITSLSLHIHVHYTRAIPFTPSFDAPEKMKVAAGRPDVQDLLYGSISCASALRDRSLEGVHGVVLAVCGPQGLVQNVRTAERGVGMAVRKAVGGVELIEEAYTL